MINKAYKIRIYPNKKQRILIAKTFGCCRFVYNYFLAERIKLYKEEGKTLSAFDTIKLLTPLKQELEWLKEPDKCSLQNVLKNLDSAYKLFFKGRGYPRFKTKRDNHNSYTTNQNIKIFDKHIQLPKLGKVKVRGKYDIQGRIVSATVSQEPSGKYYVSLCCEVEIEQSPKTNQSIGLDLGLKDFAILSNGVKIPNLKYLAKSEKRLAKLQRELSRKPKGSSNRNKARIKVARCYEKITNQRKDFLHKLSTQLVRDYDNICIEDLNVAGMVKNHNLARSISDASWSEFVRQLTYKCEWYGKQLIKVDRFYPSSQLCNNCGYKNKAVKDLKIRYWTCPECGNEVDRDINASKNILIEGLKLLAI